jgi:hypothetical protein
MNSKPQNDVESGQRLLNATNSPNATNIGDVDLDELFRRGNTPKYLQMDKDFKSPIVKINDTWFVEDALASLSYSKSKSRRNFSAHLTKLVFTPRERLESNCNGRFGKKALDATRLLAIRNSIFKYYPCKQSTVILNGDKITSGDTDENIVWVRDCIPAIDESNRVLKKQLIAWLKKNKLNKSGHQINASNSSANNPAHGSLKEEIKVNGNSNSSFYNNDLNEDFDDDPEEIEDFDEAD